MGDSRHMCDIQTTILLLFRALGFSNKWGLENYKILSLGSTLLTHISSTTFSLLFEIPRQMWHVTCVTHKIYFFVCSLNKFKSLWTWKRQNNEKYMKYCSNWHFIKIIYKFLWKIKTNTVQEDYVSVTCVTTLSRVWPNVKYI